MVSLSCRLSATGISFLGILSRQGIRPHLRSAYRPAYAGRTLARFPCSTRMRHDWGWLSSLPRGRRCPHGQRASMAAACRLSTAGPCHPVQHPATRRLLDEASARIH
jgi:hypothetical protein